MATGVAIATAAGLRAGMISADVSRTGVATELACTGSSPADWSPTSATDRSPHVRNYGPPDIALRLAISQGNGELLAPVEKINCFHTVAPFLPSLV